MENKSKLNQLFQAWPPGTIATPEWLSRHGISSNLVTWYLHSGWIKAIGRGAYVRAGEKVNWPSAIHTIQQYLKRSIHVGAKSALELAGHGHYVKLGNGSNLFIFGRMKTTLPTWFKNNTRWDLNIKFFPTRLFENYSLGLTEKEVDNLPIMIAAPERAIMESLHLIPEYQTLDEAYLIMESLVSLRPKIVQSLLENCHSIKVKRLFMHLAELYQHPWLKYVKLDHIDFGSGKRVIAGGGIYHPKYQLSLPKIEEEGNATL